MTDRAALSFGEHALRWMMDRSGYSRADLVGKCRIRRLAWCRQELMAVLELHDLSLPAIGNLLNRDHSTVIHAVRTVQMRLAAGKPGASCPDGAPFDPLPYYSHLLGQWRRICDDRASAVAERSGGSIGEGVDWLAVADSLCERSRAERMGLKARRGPRLPDRRPVTRCRTCDDLFRENFDGHAHCSPDCEREWMSWSDSERAAA